MKQTKQINKRQREIIITREFSSIGEFYSYIKETEVNETFKDVKLSSETGSYNFTGTESYEEAENLLLNGCSKMAKKLNEAVEKANMKMTKEERKMVYDICGYQASVPRYLQGVPTNMINTKVVVKKNKVITLNKMINYNCGVSTETIIDESVRLVSVIRMIESSGTRVNLNLLNVSHGSTKIDGRKYEHYEVLKIRLKNSNQKLNISKLAFPLVHPSMLRRIIFRYFEVVPTIPNSFRWGYGYPATDTKSSSINKGEFNLPTRLSFYNIDRIKDGGIETLKEITNYVEK